MAQHPFVGHLVKAVAVAFEHGGDDLLRRHLHGVELLVVVGVCVLCAADVILHKGDRLLQLTDAVVQIDLTVENHLAVGEHIFLKDLVQLLDGIAEVL